MPHDEGNNMTCGGWPNARVKVVALALASGLASAVCPVGVHAEPSGERSPSHHAYRRKAAEPARPDPDRQHRDGHMTPEERRLLRQHIEDAVRELYKR